MSHCNTVFNQLQNLMPKSKVQEIIDKHKSDKWCKGNKTIIFVKTLIFSQFAKCDSLRMITSLMKVNAKRLYHSGLVPMARSTLSHMNNRTNPIVLMDIFNSLLSRVYKVCPKFKMPIKNPTLSIDSSIISLCLSVFDWAKYRKRKGGIKIHVGLHNESQIPAFVIISKAILHDVTAIVDKVFIKGTVLIIDMAYIKYTWLFRLHSDGVFFVTKWKKNANIKLVERKKITKSQKKAGIIYDHQVKLIGHYSKKNYEISIRRVKYRDPETKRVLIFMTNNLDWSPVTVAKIYKRRWDVELFFKWIKQNLKIKKFIGTSENAVMNQIFAAMIVYLIMIYTKGINRLSWSLNQISNLLARSIFSRREIKELFTGSPPEKKRPEKLLGQLEFEWV